MQFLTEKQISQLKQVAEKDLQLDQLRQEEARRANSKLTRLGQGIKSGVAQVKGRAQKAFRKLHPLSAEAQATATQAEQQDALLRAIKEDFLKDLATDQTTPDRER